MAKKAATRRKAKTRSLQNLHGGLTAACRRDFAKKQGSHLKPGVKKRVADISPTEMRRKGSWAVRFFGREELPALVDKHGRPTRHALFAQAWGDRVPRTESAARKIAPKGHRLLDSYRRAKAKR
jgi:hypothetical protein